MFSAYLVPYKRAVWFHFCVIDCIQAGGVSCTTTSKNFESGTTTSSFFFVLNRKSFTSSLPPFSSCVVWPAFLTKFHTSLATASAFRVPFLSPSVSVPPMPLGAASPSSEISSAVIKPVERTIAPVSRERIRVLCTPGLFERRARSAAVSSEGDGCCIVGDRYAESQQMSLPIVFLRFVDCRCKQSPSVATANQRLLKHRQDIEV
jgi:hypothetical protein